MIIDAGLPALRAILPGKRRAAIFTLRQLPLFLFLAPAPAPARILFHLCGNRIAHDEWRFIRHARWNLLKVADEVHAEEARWKFREVVRF